MLSPSTTETETAPNSGRVVRTTADDDGPQQKCGACPSLDDIVSDAAAAPYTLCAFATFLEKSHCKEPLDFVLAARAYTHNYNSTPVQRRHTLCRAWNELVETYIVEDAPKEVNLPCTVRNRLAEKHALECSRIPTPPAHIAEAVRLATQLLRDNSYIPFIQAASAACACSSLGSSTAASSVSAGLDRFSNSPSPVLSLEEQLAALNIAPTPPADGCRKAASYTCALGSAPNGAPGPNGANAKVSKVVTAMRRGSGSPPLQSAPGSAGSPSESTPWRKMSVKFKWKRSNSSGNL